MLKSGWCVIFFLCIVYLHACRGSALKWGVDPRCKSSPEHPATKVQPRILREEGAKKDSARADWKEPPKKKRPATLEEVLYEGYYLNVHFRFSYFWVLLRLHFLTTLTNQNASFMPGRRSRVCCQCTSTRESNSSCGD